MSMNRTEGCDSPNRPDEGIDTGISATPTAPYAEYIDIDIDIDGSDGIDGIAVTRPAWFSDEQWDRLVTASTAHFEQLVESATGRCQTHAWCTMDASCSEHEEFHSGDIVPLSAALPSKDGLVAEQTEEQPEPGGWWCWPVRNRDDVEVSIACEGHWEDGAAAEEYQMPARDVAAVLTMTRTTAGRQALAHLLLALFGKADQ